MKVLIIGLPNQVSDSDIAEIIQATVDTTGLPIKGITIEEKDILDFSVENTKVKAVIESDFIKAVNAVVDAIGGNPEHPDVRTEFYQLVLTGKIERPILEKIVFGPRNKQESIYLKKNKLEKIVEYARIALSLIA